MRSDPARLLATDSLGLTHPECTRTKTAIAKRPRSNGRSSPVAHPIRLRRIVLRYAGHRRRIPADSADNPLYHSRRGLFRKIVAAPRSAVAVASGLRTDATGLARTGSHSTASQAGRGGRMCFWLCAILVWHSTDSHAGNCGCAIDAHGSRIRFLQTVIVDCLVAPIHLASRSRTHAMLGR
jgi:hypothetical protein